MFVNNKTLARSFLVALFIALGIIACGVESSPGRLTAPGINASLNEQPDTMWRVTGHGVVGEADFDLTIAALKWNDGRVEGTAEVTGGVRGPVVDLVAPSAAADYWCVNVHVSNLENQPDFRINFYVRDSGDGQTSFDELSYSAGDGLTCVSNPAADQNPFAPVTSGDYKGVVKAR